MLTRHFNYMDSHYTDKVLFDNFEEKTSTCRRYYDGSTTESVESAQEFCRSLGGALDFDWAIETNQFNSNFTSWKRTFFTYWTFRHRIWIYHFKYAVQLLNSSIQISRIDESMQSIEMFNSALNNQQLWTPFFDDNGNPLCFIWQQSDNATSKFFNFQYF